MLKKLVLCVLVISAVAFVGCEKDEDDSIDHPCYVSFENYSSYDYYGVRVSNASVVPFDYNQNTDYITIEAGTYDLEWKLDDGTWEATDPENPDEYSEGFYYTWEITDDYYTLYEENQARGVEDRIIIKKVVIDKRAAKQK